MKIRDIMNKFKGKDNSKNEKNNFEQIESKDKEIQKEIEIANQEFEACQKYLFENGNMMSDEEYEIAFNNLKQASDKLLEVTQQNYEFKTEISSIVASDKAIKWMENDIKQSMIKLDENVAKTDTEIEGSFKQISAMYETEENSYKL